MLEIVNDSVEAGSLKASKIGKKEDYICVMELMLEVGSLEQPYDSQYRKELYSEMFFCSSPSMRNRGENMDTYFENSVASIHTALERAKKGEDIRIWVDSNPTGQCNFSLICSLIQTVEKLGKIYVMELPRYHKRDGQIMRCSSWGRPSENPV